MDWATVAQLIISVGLPLAEKIVAKWESGAPVTLAEFQALRAEAEQTAKDRMKLMLQKAGIPLDDPKAVALLQLTS